MVETDLDKFKGVNIRGKKCIGKFEGTFNCDFGYDKKMKARARSKRVHIVSTKRSGYFPMWSKKVLKKEGW
jgi:hypothetical protein